MKTEQFIGKTMLATVLAILCLLMVQGCGDEITTNPDQTPLCDTVTSSAPVLVVTGGSYPRVSPDGSKLSLC